MSYLQLSFSLIGIVYVIVLFSLFNASISKNRVVEKVSIMVTGDKMKKIIMSLMIILLLAEQLF